MSSYARSTINGAIGNQPGLVNRSSVYSPASNQDTSANGTHTSIATMRTGTMEHLTSPLVGYRFDHQQPSASPRHYPHSARDLLGSSHPGTSMSGETVMEANGEQGLGVKLLTL